LGKQFILFAIKEKKVAPVGQPFSLTAFLVIARLLRFCKI
jgi:hypothetical protein